MLGLGIKNNNKSSPVVIIGCGLVGLRLAEKLLALKTDLSIVIFSAEQHAPYNRIQLGHLLQEEISDGIYPEGFLLPLPEQHSRLQFHPQQTVSHVDPETQTIHTASGISQTYGTLVFATGANAFVPDIPGIEKQGIEVLRTLDDTIAICEQLRKAEHITILGGGLLGVETALNLQGGDRNIHIIEHHDRLLTGQSESTYQETLKALQQANDVHIHTHSRVEYIKGSSKMSSIVVNGNTEITCDLLILATGIRANTELAQASGLKVNKGIVVDDTLQTSIPNIYAIGDCSEHRNTLYGLVKPGYEQAEILARRIAGEAITYQGSNRDACPKLINRPALENSQPIQQWPRESIICQCNKVSRGTLTQAINNGCHDIESLTDATTAGNNCGTCHHLLARLLDKKTPTVRERILQITAFLAIFSGLLYLILPGVQYRDSVFIDLLWNELWRDSLSRQITGFSLLAISAMISFIAIRKRVKKFKWGHFSNWRNSHVILGLLIIVILLIHTGARFGENLNFILMTCFIGVLLSGGLLGASIANQHKLKPSQAQKVHLGSLWLHLLLLWPLPALLIFHIIKSYYF